MNCCGKMICSGCVYAVQSRITKKKHDICPFCRTSAPASNGEMIGRFEKRVEMNGAQALYDMGCIYRDGDCGLPQDHAKALEFWHRAGELGHAESYGSG